MAHKHEHEGGLHRWLNWVSITNGALGVAQIATGLATGSGTLAVGGVHDASDGALFGLKHRVLHEQNKQRQRNLRRLGASALMAISFYVGVAEIEHDIEHPDHETPLAAGALAVVAAGFNIVAARKLVAHHHDGESGDSWKHMMGADLPGSLVTLVAVPMAHFYPEADIIGTATHMALAIGVGSQTLHNINQEK